MKLTELIDISSKIAVPVLLGLMVYYGNKNLAEINSIVQNKEQQIKKLEIAARLIPDLVSDDNRQYIALMIYGELQDMEAARKIAYGLNTAHSLKALGRLTLDSDEQPAAPISSQPNAEQKATTVNVVPKISIEVDKSAQVSPATTEHAQIQQPAKIKDQKGWVYLGYYNFSENEWEQSYWHTEKDELPLLNNLSKGLILKAVESINVREGVPNLFGTNKKKLSTLLADSQVEIIKIVKWRDTGHLWANVKFAKP